MWDLALPLVELFEVPMSPVLLLMPRRIYVLQIKKIYLQLWHSKACMLLAYSKHLFNSLVNKQRQACAAFSKPDISPINCNLLKCFHTAILAKFVDSEISHLLLNHEPKRKQFQIHVDCLFWISSWLKPVAVLSNGHHMK